MIYSFRNKITAAIFHGYQVRKLHPDLQRRAKKQLDVIHSTADLQDLRSPPSNRLEKLSGDRKGQYSVRIDSQYRVCFRWTSRGAEDVEITDYH